MVQPSFRKSQKVQGFQIIFLYDFLLPLAFSFYCFSPLHFIFGKCRDNPNRWASSSFPPQPTSSSLLPAAQSGMKRYLSSFSRGPTCHPPPSLLFPAVTRAHGTPPHASGVTSSKLGHPCSTSPPLPFYLARPSSPLNPSPIFPHLAPPSFPIRLCKPPWTEEREVKFVANARSF